MMLQNIYFPVAGREVDVNLSSTPRLFEAAVKKYYSNCGNHDGKGRVKNYKNYFIALLFTNYFAIAKLLCYSLITLGGN